MLRNEMFFILGGGGQHCNIFKIIWGKTFFHEEYDIILEKIWEKQLVSEQGYRLTKTNVHQLKNATSYVYTD